MPEKVPVGFIKQLHHSSLHWIFARFLYTLSPSPPTPNTQCILIYFCSGTPNNTAFLCPLVCTYLSNTNKGAKYNGAQPVKQKQFDPLKTFKATCTIQYLKYFTYVKHYCTIKKKKQEILKAWCCKSDY